MNCITNDIKNKSGIYKITNLDNHKCYIGQSIDLEKRYRSHRNMLRSNTHHNNHLQRAYNKGDKFVYEVMELCSINELDEREIMWIAFFDSRNDSTGYNFDIGGNRTRDRLPETLNKIKEGQRKFWSVEQNRIKQSMNKSELSVEVVIKIKIMLSKELEKSCKQIASELDVNFNSVVHIQNLNSHVFILRNLNHVIYNRNVILEKRKNKKILSMYREGYSYQQIGEVVNLHHRNVIRRVKDNKTTHDDRCRLNSINRSILKRDSLIKTLYQMGKNTVEVSRILKTSRDTIKKVLDGNSKLFECISQTRGRFQLNYK